MIQLLLREPDTAALDADLASPLTLSPEAQDLLFRHAHTTNAFRPEPVDDARIQAVYDLVKWAPTAMNSQPLRVLLVRSHQARARLVPHMAGGNRDRTAAAPLVAVLAADLDFHDELPKVFPARPTARESFADPAVRERAARFSALLQAGYLILGLRAAGLGVGPMTGFDADGVDREFFADGAHRALMVLTMGIPADRGHRPRQARLSYDEVVSTI